MADDVAAQSANAQTYPLPSYYFKVSISNVGDILCAAVSGLETEYEEISYRGGDNPVFIKLKMPGLRKTCDLTVKKGIFSGGNALLEWVNNVTLSNMRREVVTVSLLDESGNPEQSWEAVNAWPKKLTLEDRKSDGNTTFIETLVLAHEGVYVKQQP